MAETAVSLLVEQVGEIVRGHKDLISGAENELEELQRKLSSLNALLQDAPKQLRSKNLFKEMERQTKDVVCEVEDIIDTCLSAVAAKRSGRISSMLSRSRRNDFAKQIRTIREERLGPIFNKVTEDMSAMKAASEPGISQEDQWMDPKKDQFIRQERVVGFKYEEDTILNGLMEKKQQLDVISIIGMPGLGKTTLAWKIFQRSEVVDAFPIRIWIHVSQRFNRKDVFCNILRKFTSENVYNMSDQELATRVRPCLADKKFLLVFDDIWDVEDWKTIQNVLPHSNGMSKVLVTSRLQTVGTYASSTREAHMLRFLTQDESWDLLQLTVFGNLEDWPQELISIGKHIARNCDGLPIAIVMIGGILLEQFTRKRSSSVVKKEWEKVVENMGMFLQEDKGRSISGIVALSYDGLPDNLKECFLYLGVFPEDYEIPAWTLTRLWIAEVNQKNCQQTHANEQCLTWHQRSHAAPKVVLSCLSSLSKTATQV